MKRLAAVLVIAATLLPFGTARAQINCASSTASTWASGKCYDTAAGNIAYQMRVWCKNSTGVSTSRYGPVRYNNEADYNTGLSSKATCPSGYWRTSNSLYNWFR